MLPCQFEDIPQNSTLDNCSRKTHLVAKIGLTCAIAVGKESVRSKQSLFTNLSFRRRHTGPGADTSDSAQQKKFSICIKPSCPQILPVHITTSETSILIFHTRKGNKG
ncbi:hypothetical protein AV530_016541 [Patagioenas fasciata monilis]|uniref:Uncharacterized protein n=1 Tax=Patagioenas fasciata monilis TaxID=372326 RepID=A0A1V4J2U3_PATFA|nr:hypothetical protein AV530_016541 [Patagioenas fasciata monilis]